MDFASGTALRSLPRRFSSYFFPNPLLRPTSSAPPSIFICSWPNYPRHSPICYAKKKESTTRFVPKEITVKEEVENAEGEEALGGLEDEKEGVIEDLGDEMLEDDTEDFEDGDDFVDENEDADPQVGDGDGGGGISLAGTWWDQKALTIAGEVSQSFNGNFKLYAFKTLANSTIRVRIEKMSSKYGSPTMDDIEAFSSAYQLLLDQAEREGAVPNDMSLEVSSPGVERVVRVPEELERFKERPMYVRYMIIDDETNSLKETDGVFSLVSLDLESCSCIWSIADVKINRQKAGKGRPLSKKQRQWTLQTPFDSLSLVRLHSDF